MNRAAAAVLLCCSGLVAAGCAGPTLRMTTDRVNYTPVARADVERPCRAPHRVCVLDAATSGFNGKVVDSRINTFRTVFSAAARAASPSEPQCDVSVRFPNTWNDNIEVVAPDGRFLASAEMNIAEWSAKALCLALQPGGALTAQAPARLAPAAAPVQPPAAAPAAPSLTREDIAAAVAAAMKQNAPAATAARALALPRFTSAERPDDLAVVVGVENYSDIATKAPYAERDAEAFKAHVRALGVPERNIVLLTGSKAVRSALVKNVEGWLPRMAKPDSRVYFYFSGHGAPDVKTGRAYLVPWDGDPNFLEATAYPVAQLYQKLAALPAKQVLVAMDSCFSGAGGRSVLASGARPLVAKVETGEVPAKLTVLAASASDEISGSLDAQGHGAFTWFLLEGLNSGKTTAKALHAYLTPKVQDEARRLNRDQTPQLLGADATLR